MTKKATAWAMKLCRTTTFAALAASAVVRLYSHARLSNRLAYVVKLGHLLHILEGRCVLIPVKGLMCPTVCSYAADLHHAPCWTMASCTAPHTVPPCPSECPGVPPHTQCMVVRVSAALQATTQHQHCGTSIMVPALWSDSLAHGCATHALVCIAISPRQALLCSLSLRNQTAHWAAPQASLIRAPRLDGCGEPYFAYLASADLHAKTRGYINQEHILMLEELRTRYGWRPVQPQVLWNETASWDDISSAADRQYGCPPAVLLILLVLSYDIAPMARLGPVEGTGLRGTLV